MYGSSLVYCLVTKWIKGSHHLVHPWLGAFIICTHRGALNNGRLSPSLYLCIHPSTKVGTKQTNICFTQGLTGLSTYYISTSVILTLCPQILYASGVVLICFVWKVFTRLSNCNWTLIILFRLQKILHENFSWIFMNDQVEADQVFSFLSVKAF